MLLLFQTSDLDDTSSRDSQEVSRVPCLPFTFLWDGFRFLTCAQFPNSSFQSMAQAHFHWYQKVQRQQNRPVTGSPCVLSFLRVGHSYGVSQQDLLSLSKSGELNYFELLLIVSFVGEQEKISLTPGTSVVKSFHLVHNFSVEVIGTLSGG